MAQRSSTQAWLFSPRVDAAAFLGSAVLSLLFVLGCRAAGIAGDTPLWAWVLLVVCIDVAHVWSTLFRVYFDGEELQRRASLYAGVPLLVYAVGVAAYQSSALSFWRLFAYAALFHFVRQQYGFITLYNRKARVPDWERRLDAAVIYACTVGPALWWHARIPRPFWWFVQDDFVALPPWVGDVALGGMWLLLGAWAAAQVARAVRGRGVFMGRVLLVTATFIAWFGGIVLAADDLAFTAMNVALHGVPYFVLLYRYAKNRSAEGNYAAARVMKLGVFGFFGLLVAFAFAEEFLWDRLVWHDHAALFGASAGELSALLPFLVPLLALPQATHYVLDAFIWKPKQDPKLLARLGWASVPRDGERLAEPDAEHQVVLGGAK